MDILLDLTVFAGTLQPLQHRSSPRPETMPEHGYQKLKGTAVGLFGRLLGTERPELPAGKRYIIDGDGTGSGFVIQLVLAGQDTGDPSLRKVGPVFTDLMEAGKYRVWLEGGPQYVYPMGEV